MYELILLLAVIAAGVGIGAALGVAPGMSREFRDLRRHQCGRECQAREYQERSESK